MLLFTLSRKRLHLLSLFLIFAVACSDDESPTPDTEEIETTDDNGSTEEPVDMLEVAFIKTYGGSQADSFRDVIATSDGGFATLGFSQSVDGDIIDNSEQVNMYWMVKTDTEGAIQWSKTYGGNNDDRGQKLIQTQDGGYALAGFAQSSDGDITSNEGFYDQWVVKLDASGNVQWERNFGFSGSDQANAIVQTSDGGYFVAGFLDVSASDGEGNDGRHGVGEFWVHKLDANGNLIWRRFFGGSNNDRANDVVATTDGGVIMVGSSESDDFDITNPKGSYDFWAVKIDSNGNLQWQKNYGGSETDTAYAITTTADGNYIIAGDTRSADGDITNFKGTADVWIVKINNQGDLIWEKTLGGTGFDAARDIIPQGNGFVITGASRSEDGDITENKGQSDIWVAQLDADGDVQWQKTLGGSGLDFGYGAAVSQNGSIMIAGDGNSNDQDITGSNGSIDGLLIKIE
ncbi:hypothetical protein EAX61_09925 [Dokdonia sinensis]|uniref:Bulb-type lectin domain-containing protein n=2 Tax=Dokdonia sinensis TaxID=2479847 RepID=A0A3M0G1F7_9FLAO|nr:hypothetical protein EAX61_09925 [Dokdonia sinensis]